jgi:Papain family cysteine protease
MHRIRPSAQGRCGCCWSISCMGAVEGATYITNTYLDSLSFQQLISCDTGGGVNEGCQGGNIAYALQYAVSNAFGGLTLYNDYPFVDSDGTTTTTCETAGKPLDVEVFEPVVVVSYTDTSSSSDRIQSIKQAVATQPVSITMNANCNTISAYAGGVLTDDGDCACADVSCIDHAILIVGYNDTYNPPYWIIKNSWVRRSGTAHTPIHCLHRSHTQTCVSCRSYRGPTGASRGTFWWRRRAEATGACSGSWARRSSRSRPRTSPDRWRSRRPAAPPPPWSSRVA